MTFGLRVPRYSAPANLFRIVISMNRRCYRLVFNQHRRMLMAVEESAAGMGKGRHGASRAERATANGGTHQVVARFGLPAVTLAAWLVWGLPVHVRAQVVADPNAGAHRPTVVQTACQSCD
ncbi:ESPR domain-containing protein [Cupriavidus sp. JZ107]